MAHTPGPYNVYDTSTGWTLRGGTDQHVIAEGLRKEDAFFLRAAPELLEALQAIFADNCFYHKPGDERAYRLAMAAIAKATTEVKP